MDVISICISVIALLVSLITLWLTRFRKGTIKITKPTVIFFGPDGSGKEHNKIFIRTLLYSTSDRGQYIENMYIRLSRGRGATIQDFNIWVYGDQHNLARGSGLFISKDGLAANHHFLLPKDGSNFIFKQGDYRLEVYAELVNNKPRKIYAQDLTISDKQAEALLTQEAGIYFDWAPNTQSYQSHIDNRPAKSTDVAELLKHLGSSRK
jgi:hypothetical protein